jgi:hypothetical protein
MIKKIILLFIILTKVSFAQTVAETILLSLAQGVSESDFLSAYIAPKFHNGFIVINSDTIRGQIKVGGRKVFFFNDSIKKIYKNHSFVRRASGVMFYPFVRNNPQWNFVRTKKVTSVRLFAADTMITKNSYMDFIHIGTSSSLFRRIYAGSIEIFDRNYITDESAGYFGDNLIVLDNGNRLGDAAPESNPKKYLIKCINKKFDKNFGRTDFRRMIDVIKWLQANDKSYIGP